MNITDKKAFCRQLIQTVWNEGKIDSLDNFVTPNSRYTDPSGSFKESNVDALKKYVLSFHKAFPDLNCKVEYQIAEGEQVATFMTVTATHEGEFLGLPASHKKASVPAIVIQRFEGDKIAEGFTLWDTLTFLRNAGAFEAHEPALASR
ncbi:MAG: ester cyclase [Deltaproteobacteria bacterium]